MLSKLEVHLRSVMRFVDWIYVSNNFISCNIKTIRKVKDIQTCGTNGFSVAS